MAADLEDFEHLLRHPGWLRLCALVRAEWHQRMAAGTKTALNDTNDVQALNKLRQITAAHEAVEWVLQLPQEHPQKVARQTETQTAHHSVSRRGPL